ncbi:MAG TPA: hypothetical protein VGV12_07145 [Gemmatimonadales bacterium]|nr:hypothetical protein [Gemmatimonadales bacterium]
MISSVLPTVIGAGRRIRAACADDIPQIADLRSRVFSWRQKDSAEEREAAVSRVFFENPFLDPELPSLVCTNERGRIIGFLGVSARTFQWQGSPVRVAVQTGFMVEPSSRGIPGVMLLRRVMGGPQALTLADSPNPPGRKLIERLGGMLVPADSLYWVRPLRPVRYAVGQVRSGPLLFTARVLARPLATGVDALATRVAASPFYLKRPDTREGPLSAAEHARGLAAMAQLCALSPAYEESQLQWLMDALHRGPRGRDFQHVLVRSSTGDVIGWYVRYANRHGVSEVVQIGARKDRYGDVLDHLFYAAWRDGSVAVSGRAQPMFMGTLADKGCIFSRNGPPMMVYSRHADLLEDIRAGRAFMSRLDGEWLMIQLSLS